MSITKFVEINPINIPNLIGKLFIAVIGGQCYIGKYISTYMFQSGQDVFLANTISQLWEIVNEPDKEQESGIEDFIKHLNPIEYGKFDLPNDQVWYFIEVAPDPNYMRVYFIFHEDLLKKFNVKKIYICGRDILSEIWGIKFYFLKLNYRFDYSDIYTGGQYTPATFREYLASKYEILKSALNDSDSPKINITIKTDYNISGNILNGRGFYTARKCNESVDELYNLIYNDVSFQQQCLDNIVINLYLPCGNQVYTLDKSIQNGSVAIFGDFLTEYWGNVTYVDQYKKYFRVKQYIHHFRKDDPNAIIDFMKKIESYLSKY